MASNKRDFSQLDEREAKKPKLSATDNTTVKLNPADCTLDFDIEANGLRGKGLYDKGFAYCWSGARANVGIKRGRYSFSCKIVDAQPVEMEDTPVNQQHVCRIGISRGDDAVGNLGETAHSFGYGGTGKFSAAGKFSDYGETFGVGDTIVCTVDLDSKPLASVGFYKNGKWLGVAREFNAGVSGLGVVDSPVKERDWESAIFPHVLLKNVVVELQFSVEDGLVLEAGQKTWSCAMDDGNAVMGPVFSNSCKECEVLMMVGLPASGKTTWAEKWVNEHPEKRYILLGTNLALDQMKVPGLLRKQNYGERFDRLMERATGIFNTLLDRASKTPRNFILDQTNVYKGARKRKLRPFFQYQKIAVVVFPKPDVLKLRSDKRFKEMGKEVPAEAVNEMLANYVLPTSKDMRGSDEFFDQVWFPELNREDTQRYLEEMKQAQKFSSESPYSSRSSVQSYPVTPLPIATGQHNPSSPAVYDRPIPEREIATAYPGVGSQGPPRYGYGHGQQQYGPGSESYGNYGTLNPIPRFNSEMSPIPGGATGQYQNYGGSPYAESRDSVRTGGTVLYQSPGKADPYYSRASSESTYGSNFGDLSTPLSYRSSGDPRSTSQLPREPAFSPYPEQLSTFRSTVGSASTPPAYNNHEGPRFAHLGPMESPINSHIEKPSTYGPGFGWDRAPSTYTGPGVSGTITPVHGRPTYAPDDHYSSYGPSYGAPPPGPSYGAPGAAVPPPGPSYGAQPPGPSYGAPPPTVPYGSPPPSGWQQPRGFHPGRRY